MKKIVIVEDDVFLREELEYIFEKKGYAVESISSFASPLEDIMGRYPSLVLLDLNLPGQSGFELCRSLKVKGIGPILVLTSRSQLKDELHAFELGADDYLTKPCHPDRMAARAEKLLKLYESRRHLLNGPGFQLDENTFEVIKANQSQALPENEGKLLRVLLMEAPGAVAKETLLKGVWGTSDYVDENILQVNMTRLRKNLGKIGLENINETVRGTGYRIREGENL